MNEFLLYIEIYSLLKLNQDEANDSNRPITSTEIEKVAKKYPSEQKGQTDSVQNSTRPSSN